MVSKAHHSAWKRLWRAKNAGKVKALRDELVDYKRALKNLPCADCGNVRPLEAMEFDHREGSQKVNKISYCGLGKKATDAEVSKCDVVCVLCHRLRSYARYANSFSPSRTALAKRKIQERVNEFKRSPCADCGLAFFPVQMDFHHLDPTTKNDKIANLVKKRTRWTVIAAEIAKCQVLCALCHRLRAD